MKEKPNKFKFKIVALICAVVTTIIYFGYTVLHSMDMPERLTAIIAVGILTLFVCCFCFVGLKQNSKNQKYVILTALLMTLYSSFQLLTNMNILKLPMQETVKDFTNKSSVEVSKWATKNNISLNQEFEYSDSVDEYYVISQDVQAGTLVKKVDEMAITVSDGPNLEKEVIIPNMVGWKAEDVLDFIKKNHLSNVDVEFVLSDKTKDTVIAQDVYGKRKRSDPLKLTFSLGSEADIKPTKMIDLTNKSKFEATFWLKQHAIKYQEKTDYSETIRRNYVMAQSIKKGITVDPNKDSIDITISKGSKIIVPDLMKMSLAEITEWITANKLKIEITDKYDESIKVNMPIEVNYKAGDVIEEGTIIKLIISKGKLVMEEFTSLADFKTWADQYGIKYNEEYEFSDTVAQGDIIKWSHKKGDVLKNNDAVTVTISQGRKTSVPDFSGKTKNECNKLCNQYSLSCSFLYKYNNSVAEGKAFAQSKSAGLEVAENTSVSITLSNGKAPANSGSSNNNSGSSNTNPTPSCDTSKGAKFYIAAGNNGRQVFEATKNQNPGFNITANYVQSCPNGSTASGSVCNSSQYHGKWISYCTTITLTIVE